MTPMNRRGLLGAGLGSGLALLGPATPLSAQDPDTDAENRASIGRTPHTRFAVNVEMWWRGLPFLERIARAAELGFPAVEFWPWKGKDLAGVEETCGELGIAVAQFTAWGFNPGLNDPRNHDAFEGAIGEACEVAQRLGARHATVVAGNDQPGVSQEEMHAHVTAGLRRVAPLAEAADVTLILEPMNVRVDHVGHCLYGSPAAVKICRDVDSSHVKINWDLYHMQISEGDLCGRLREGFDQVGYLQLADHPGRNEPGTGEIHYPRVLRQAHELGYRGFVGLECRPRHGELEAARAVARADRW